MNEVETGKLGEHICCVRLIKLGFGAEIVNLNKTDVIVDKDVINETNMSKKELIRRLHIKKDNKVFFAYGHHHIGLTAGPKTGEMVGKNILRDNDQTF